MENYKVIKVKFNEESNSSHHLFYKAYKSNRNSEELSKIANRKSNDLPYRSLFVEGVPPYLNEESLMNIFGCFGQVEHALIYAEPNSDPFTIISNEKNKLSYFYDDQSKLDCFKLAYIVFKQIKSVDQALKNPTDKERIASTKQKPIAIGFKKWIDDYKNNFIKEKKLQKEIDEFMLNYDEIKEKKEQEEKEKTNQPDEDGWVTIKTKNRKANRSFTERNIQKIKQKQKKKMDKMKLVNFYSFQAKESKKEYIEQLRKKFEEDKLKIEEMKKNRKFKPF